MRGPFFSSARACVRAAGRACGAAWRAGVRGVRRIRIRIRIRGLNKNTSRIINARPQSLREPTKQFAQ